MNFVAIFMAVFSVIGAIDRIFGNRFGLGKQFESGFMMFGNLALSMIGMIIISPLIATSLAPLFNVVRDVLHIDPSVIPASFFANDMGGATLAVEIATNKEIGLFNALVVSSMMGATFSFSVPYAIGVVEEERHKEMFLGLLCGIATIPLGCFISGIVLKIPLLALLINLLPIVLFSGLIACGLVFCPDVCVKIFAIFGKIMKIVITIGLMLGVIRFLTGVEVLNGLATLEEGAAICLNASIVMSGAFTFLNIVSRCTSKLLTKAGAKLGINEVSALGFLSSLATNVTTFEMMNRMDKKGIVLNSAFAVSAAFTFAGHLAFTMAFNIDYIPAVTVGKLSAGISALILAMVFYKRTNKGEA